MNENYAMPAMPEGAKEGILKGMYKLKASENTSHKLKANLLGSGTMVNEALKAQKILEEKYKVSADVWSVTSYKELRRDALDADRWNLLHPTAEQKIPYITKCFTNDEGVIVASSDYVKTLPDSIAKWLPKQIVSLGTDGFGRSEARPELRDFFEVDARYIVIGTLFALAKEGKIKMTQVEKSIKELEINPEKLNPMIA